MTSGVHLEVTGAAGPSCRGWRERSKAGVATPFHVLMLTRRQRVELAWHATCAKVVNLKLKLLSSGKVVSVILRVIFG